MKKSFKKRMQSASPDQSSPTASVKDALKALDNSEIVAYLVYMKTNKPPRGEADPWLDGIPDLQGIPDEHFFTFVWLKNQGLMRMLLPNHAVPAGLIYLWELLPNRISEVLCQAPDATFNQVASMILDALRKEPRI